MNVLTRIASNIVLALLIAIIDVEFFKYAVYGGLYNGAFMTAVVQVVVVVAINIGLFYLMLKNFWSK